MTSRALCLTAVVSWCLRDFSLSPHPSQRCSPPPLRGHHVQDPRATLIYALSMLLYKRYTALLLSVLTQSYFSEILILQSEHR